ncbi:bifunctional 4-hydroxy-2-oxoglutarate aldolase/2-dehydro-3-deoxy-phosphogluconate aldolase [Pleionea mediterranea]|uniref:2-dehydro-3-deoxy-phosphogluconate aldolase n=1 Tax=Pleionea mediterranea TaxID=523701 RepID=A0A316FQB1_9GAMM|nr:bifunctional 4-hydroxy-2-oxoglutarate aldolase/2-dehydro-3-deoxy-phosphogluconate aldolase [Pleionea mediterranea]PWK50809.1 2-keto-3-deoxy-phosphogluconate aldolase [Pleionea mediterranea]
MVQHHPIRHIMQQAPVVPVLVIRDLEKAVPLAKALVNGGLNVLEITLRSDVALEAIERIQADVPNAIVGAGTVTNEQQLAELDKRNVAFAVSPGLTPKLLSSAESYKVALLPGVANASQIMMGMEYGYENFKFFPAEASGGIAALKSFYGPFNSLRFCPTGGISPSNFKQYLDLPNVECVGGTWVAPDDLIEANNWGEIERLAKAAVVDSQ